MTWFELIAIIPIVLSAVAILAGIFHSRAIYLATPFILASNRPPVMRLMRHHRILMVFFLVAYVVLACALVAKFAFVTDLFIGATAFLVATFIYAASVMESKLFSEMRNTVSGLVPLCAMCKRVRLSGADPMKQNSWMEIEQYISQETGNAITHGYCPACADSLLPGKADPA